MNRADPPGVAVHTTTRSSVRSILALTAALAMLLTALAGTVGRASEPASPGATHVTVAASLDGRVPGPVVVPPASGHPTQAATWLWWIPADRLPPAALLAAVLLAVAGSTVPSVRTPAPPPGRGPPRVALSS